MKKILVSAFLFLALTTSAYAEVYIVKSGDTLITISQKLGLPLESIKGANPSIKSTNLQIGERIVIPVYSNAKIENKAKIAVAKTYTVEKGDTALTIANKLHISLNQLKTLNPNRDLSKLNIGEHLVVPSFVKSVAVTQSKFYEVKPEDTASQIATMFNIPLSEIAKLNPQLDLTSLNIGDKIILPSRSTQTVNATQKTVIKNTSSETKYTYTVQPKDTLSAISYKTGISMDEIRKLNPNLDWTNLQIGQKIVLNNNNPAAQISQKILNKSQLHILESSNYIKYTVNSGDSLYSIAKAFSTTIKTLKSINALTSNNLSVGQTLLVPPKIIAQKNLETSKSIQMTRQSQLAQVPPVSKDTASKFKPDFTSDNYSLYLDHYTVKQGETLYSISKKFDTSVNDIVSLNNLSNNEISVGEVLLIPKNNAKSTNTNYSTEEYSLVNKENGLNKRLIKYAKLFVGAPYRWGGTNLNTGVDCSGFVQDVFAKFHIDLPRTSQEQFNIGKPISLTNLKPGDLLFFQTYNGPSPTHVGIYIGDNKFISALNHDTGVIVSKLDGYFLNRFVGARRILPSNERLNDTGNRPG